MLEIVIIYLLLINIVAFMAYGIDKGRAVKHIWRISETTLISIALLGGSVGAFMGMHYFHHKTKKPKFYIGVPVIIIIHIILVVVWFYLYKKL